MTDKASAAQIHAIILTFNEEQHIARCIESIKDHCTIIVVDSGSTDQTVAIARSLGAVVHTNRWINYATQFNHGLTLVPTDASWVLRIDADEVLEQGWAEKFKRLLADRPDVKGVAVRRYIRFGGTLIKWGGCVTWQLRLFDRHSGQCETRWMDEHIVVDGPVAQLPVALTDDNLNDVRWWTQKHIAYADREAVDTILEPGHGSQDDQQSSDMVVQAKIKRFLKNRVYRKLPTAFRATAYFVFRYIVLLGFLDGRRGFQFHFLQGWWYRFYTDLRIKEVLARVEANGGDVAKSIKQVTGLDITAR